MRADRTPGLALSTVYTAAIFLSAVLMFWLEPMFPKAILPLMGGTPATWVTALMFYQAVLLLGYAYCFAITRWLSHRAQMGIHLALLATTALTLPPTLPDLHAGFASPVMLVLTMLTMGAGLPLFALSATAPLMQHWFSRSGHRHAHDPYFLYAASNVGGLGALLAYPVVIESFLGLSQQASLWTLGFGLFAAAIVGCIVLGRPSTVPAAAPVEATVTAKPDGERWMWLLLAAGPSSLLSGTTTRITTDIAAGPLFWVVPLALYLLTFVLAFARRRVLPMRLVLLLQPVALVPVVIAAFALFFLSAYICHARLADSRPSAARSSEFYLMMALGGLLGGTFNALVAPNLFSGIAEYPLALVLAIALRPATGKYRHGRDLMMALAIGTIAVAVLLFSPPDKIRVVSGIMGVVFAIGLVAMAGAPGRFAAGLTVAFLLAQAPNLIQPPLAQHRNFFGVVKVLYDRRYDMNLMVNGSVSHGGQLRAPALRRQLTSYYSARGPYGDVIALRTAEGRAADIAAIGLGTGTIACSGPADARWTFFEINPVVVDLARDPRFFSFLADCQPQARILVGDGRLMLATEQGKFDLIVLDAFSSDSIPMHLLTLEAFTIYFDKLKPDGVIAINISNKFVDLNPVLAAVAGRLGLTILGRYDKESTAVAHSSRWVAMSRAPDTLSPLLARPGWEVIEQSGTGVWSDDRSGLFQLLHFRSKAPQ